jgi:hypothetical protein
MLTCRISRVKEVCTAEQIVNACKNPMISIGNWKVHLVKNRKWMKKGPSSARNSNKKIKEVKMTEATCDIYKTY